MFFRPGWQSYYRAIEKARNAFFAESTNSFDPETLLLQWTHAVNAAEKYMSEKTLREGCMSSKTLSRYSIFVKEREAIGRAKQSMSAQDLSPGKVFGSFMGKPDMRIGSVSSRLVF